MGRRMAFSKTLPQMYAGTKDVTRRDGWEFLCDEPPGTVLTAIEKGMGLKRGERHVVIRDIEVLGARREPLGAITPDDVAREGFPGETPEDFIRRFGKPADYVLTRVEFRHIYRLNDTNGRPRRHRGEEDDMARSKKTTTANPKPKATAKPKTPPARPVPRQQKVPGTVEPDIDELDELCAQFKERDDSMHAEKAECNKLRGAISMALEKHDRMLYEFANKRFIYQPGAPKLKVQTLKDDED